PNSREHYRDFKPPHKFEGLLQRVWSEEDDSIYHVPFSSLAHLVTEPELSLGQPYGVLSPLDPYPAAIVDPKRPRLTTAWKGASDLGIEGRIDESRLISVQVNHDPGWRAEQDGHPIPIKRDRLGYLLLRPNASPMAHIHLLYRGTNEQHIMAAVSAIVW